MVDHHWWWHYKEILFFFVFLKNQKHCCHIVDFGSIWSFSVLWSPFSMKGPILVPFPDGEGPHLVPILTILLPSYVGLVKRGKLVFIPFFRQYLSDLQSVAIFFSYLYLGFYLYNKDYLLQGLSIRSPWGRQKKYLKASFNHKWLSFFYK